MINVNLEFFYTGMYLDALLYFAPSSFSLQFTIILKREGALLYDKFARSTKPGWISTKEHDTAGETGEDGLLLKKKKVERRRK